MERYKIGEVGGMRGGASYVWHGDVELERDGRGRNRVGIRGGIYIML